MSLHSYSRCWLHIVWATLDREPMLPRAAAAKASQFLTDYSIQKGIYLRINHFNSDHVHALIDLPTNKTIEEVTHLFKGSSSHWINEQRCSEVSSPGAEATAHFQFRILTLTEYQHISLFKRSIIEREPLTKNTSYSLRNTVWNGGMTETVETVPRLPNLARPPG